MNRTITLTVTSLLTILLSSFHLADDVVKGFEPGGPSNYTGVRVTAIISAVLAAHGLWDLQRGRTPR